MATTLARGGARRAGQSATTKTSREDFLTFYAAFGVEVFFMFSLSQCFGV
jgi:hypothetical protein